MAIPEQRFSKRLDEMPNQLNSLRPLPYAAATSLARQGKLEVRKEGRNWVSSLDAVYRYTESRLRKRK